MVTLLCSFLLVQPAPALPTDSSRHTHRAYVGIGANLGRYVDARYGGDIGKNPQLSPSLTAGIQLRPSFALEVGVLTTTAKRSSSSAYFDYSPDRTTYTVSYEDGSTFRRYYILPVLARFTIAEGEDTKLDFLTGATIFYAREQAEITRYNDMRVVTEHLTSSKSVTSGRFVFGVGLRLKLTPNLELAHELRANPRLIIGFHSGSQVMLPLNLDVGVRYHFGAIKSSVTAPSAPN